MKTALIFGASSGIGAATAVKLLESKWQVFGAARSVDKLNAIALKYPHFVPLACDVTDEDQVEATFAAASQDQLLDAVITTAGVYLTDAPLKDTTLEQWENLHITNSRSNFIIARAAERLFWEKAGVFIALSSLGGLNHWVLPGNGAYSSTKHSVTAVVAALKAEWDVAKSPSQAFCVCPGLVETPMVEGRLKDHPNEKGTGITAESAGAAISELATHPERFDSWLYRLGPSGLQPEIGPTSYDI